jgi:hypothetical protein
MTPGRRPWRGQSTARFAASGADSGPRSSGLGASVDAFLDIVGRRNTFSMSFVRKTAHAADRSEERVDEICPTASMETYMRFRVLVAILSVSVFASTCSRLLLAEESILFGLDGRLWIGIAKSECAEIVKLSMVRGIYDGLMYGRSDQLKRFQIKNTSFDNLIRGLDTFYSDYRNERIPVFAALQVVALELQGRPPDEIDQLTRGFRGVVTSSEAAPLTPKATPRQ